MHKGVHLRPLERRDAERMLEWMRDEDVTRYLTIGGSGVTLEKALGFIDSARDETVNLHRAIVDENDIYLGTVSLKRIDRHLLEAEYAISLHAEAIGRGVAKIATGGILACAFESLGLRRVYLNVMEDNQRAVKFYEKFGFRFTGTTSAVLAGQERCLRWYERLNDEK